MRRAIYPGTFDPITNGHLDVVSRACHIFDEVIITVAENVPKGPIFSLERRLALIEEILPGYPKASVRALDGLTVDFARQVEAQVIIRGLRAVSDFEYEFQMAQMNRHLSQDIETIFMMPSQEYFYTSSHIVRQVAYYSSNRVAAFVPANVMRALAERFPSS